MNETRDTLIQTIRHNPVPAALAGVGLAWLLMNRSSSAGRSHGEGSRGGTGSSGHDPFSPVRDAARQGSRVAAASVHRASDAVSHAGHGIVSTATEALTQASETVHHAGESAGAMLHGVASAAGHVSNQAVHAASQLGHGASDAASSAIQGAWSQARRVEQGFESTLHESPLAVGAAVLVAGAALGYALPRTSPENALMGKSRDQFVHGAEAIVHDAAEAVGHITDKTGDAAKQALQGAEPRS